MAAYSRISGLGAIIIPFLASELRKRGSRLSDCPDRQARPRLDRERRKDPH
jgi:hypothetical protein